MQGAERAKRQKVQTNLKLDPSIALALDVAAAIEGKEKAAIVEESLRLREALMGEEYRELVRAALTVRYSDDPEARLRAIEALRDEVSGATPGGSVTVTAALAKLRARSLQPA
jgi:hypothetical protein